MISNAPNGKIERGPTGEQAQMVAAVRR